MTREVLDYLFPNIDGLWRKIKGVTLLQVYGEAKGMDDALA